MTDDVSILLYVLAALFFGSALCFVLDDVLAAIRSTHGQGCVSGDRVESARPVNPAGPGVQRVAVTDAEPCHVRGHIGPRPSRRWSVDRINNDGNYEPGNVRWATAAMQGRNTSRSRLYEINGKMMTARDMGALAGISHQAVWSRLGWGWTPLEAATVARGEIPPRFVGRDRAFRHTATVSTKDLSATGTDVQRCDACMKPIVGFSLRSTAGAVCSVKCSEAIDAHATGPRGPGWLSHMEAAAEIKCGARVQEG